VPLISKKGYQMEAHETHETIHETAHHGSDHGHAAHPKASRNKKIAILISVLACLLAITEALGKNAQNTSLSANIHANDTWSFYQAKTIRMTVLKADADILEYSASLDKDGKKPELITKRANEWRSIAERLDSDPEKGEGRKELMAKALADEELRDRSLSAYHLFEYASAALEIAIVLCSASVVTDMILLAFMAGGLAILGVGFSLLGMLAPAALH
jgi:hypothetical protein